MPGASRPAARPAVLAGLDLGTNKSCVLAGAPGSTDISVSKIVPTVVGYVREGLVEGIIPGNANLLFGEEALKNRLHLHLVAPLEKGVIAQPEPAREFLKHLRGLVDPQNRSEIRAVVGVPANASEQAREDIRRASTGIFDRLLLIPEPFLAALGFRDDGRLNQQGYVDPVLNSLFIDIGGGTTDLCLVQGYFPHANDQISFDFAGDAIDALILDAINRNYPNTGLSAHKIREIKEAHSYVGAIRKPIDVKVVIGGKARELELGQAIGDACNELLRRILESTKTLIARASNDSVTDLLQNIIVTGGGSQIRGIDTELQRLLQAEGYESPRVKLVGPDYKRYVAVGALKAARAARENQWQYLLS